MLWIVDGGMVELPVMARIEDWQEGEHIDITTGDDSGEWRTTPMRYEVRGECHPIISDNLTESEGMGDAWADCSECGHLLFVLTDPHSIPPNYCPNCGRRIMEVDG